EFPHQPLAALGIAGDDGQLPGEVDILEAAGDPRLEIRLALVAPAGQVDEADVDIMPAQERRGDEGGMRLAKTREQLADRQHMRVEMEMAVGAQALEVDQ